MTQSPQSSVPGVRAYLIAQFTAATANFTDPTVEVYASQPNHETTQDIVVVGGVNRQTPTVRLVGSGGPLWQDEKYSIDVEIACYIAGNDPFPDVDVRAFDVLVACERAIRADPSANGQVVQMNPETSTSTHEWDDSDSGTAGGNCNITLTVEVHATY